MLKKCLNRIEQIDQLIRQKATGSPRELAAKVGLSERMIYEYLDLMKHWGAPIEYSNSRKSYCYTNDVEFKFGFVKVNKNNCSTAILLH